MPSCAVEQPRADCGRKDLPGADRILFIRLSAVGDVVFSLPALAALRRGLPDATIGFLVEDRARDLIQGHPLVDRVHHYPRRRWTRMARRPWLWPGLWREISAFAAEIRRENYAVALDFQANIKGAFLGLLSGARRRIGFSRGHCKEFNHLFTHVHVTPRNGSVHRVEKFLNLAAALGIRADEESYILPDSRENRDRVIRFLSEAGLRTGGYMAVHPGTSDFGRQKRWVPERFAEVAERIGRSHSLRSVVTWGPGELELARGIVARSGGQAILSPETTSLLDLAEILRNARLFVGCDSGPLHLASAVGVSSIALFGPKDPGVYGPRSPRSRVIYKPGTNGTTGTMLAITTEDVCSAVEAMLDPRQE